MWNETALQLLRGILPWMSRRTCSIQSQKDRIRGIFTSFVYLLSFKWESTCLTLTSKGIIRFCDSCPVVTKKLNGKYTYGGNRFENGIGYSLWCPFHSIQLNTFFNHETSGG